MKLKSIVRIIAFVVTVLVFAGVAPSSAQAAPTAAQQAQIDQLKKTYPLETCPVSGDKLDSPDMGGKPVDYLYTQKNADGTETTRLVRFCCKDCLVKFKKNPDKYLKTLDAAQAKKVDGAMPPSTPQ